MLLPGEPGCLSDITVIDMSSMLAAPLSAMLLGDYGARVIKVERPGGDTSRFHGVPYQGTSLWWPLLGRNKEAITLNLKDPRGLEILRTLLDTADVLIENMRPGKLEKLGLEPAELHRANPGLIIARVTGWGQTGPYADRAAYGTLIEAQSGLAHATGEKDGPPSLPPFPLADTTSGCLTALATMIALWGRERDPEHRGQVIDASIFEMFFSLLGPQTSVWDKLGKRYDRMGSRSHVIAPRNVYLARDGRWVAISSAAENVAERIFAVVERSDLYEQDERFRSNIKRVENVEAVDEVMQEWISRHDADDVVAQFSAAGAAAAAVNTIEDILADPHFQFRELVTSVETDMMGTLKMQNVVPKLSRTPGSVRWAGREVGADSDAILGELGISANEIDGLRKEGVI